MLPYLIRYSNTWASTRQRAHDEAIAKGMEVPQGFQADSELRFADLIEVDGGAVLFYLEGEVVEVLAPGMYGSVRNVDMVEDKWPGD
ncbi:hypothetical protein [Nocardioides aurantiacus]|uniref:Uncharacterized protein n=1 Tax=Nocardioides aurantiacus TaxID=86796 RepID=A0A3N2CYI4_9ACTN|nr:hypothetical protein [Nocardioides aurantiacus]ROR92592.1 hypothetical protein EDD33_3484 [Nocardioides aurantiacus]